jgi:hypothetical protein
MVQKTPGRKTYRTANGKSIDLDQLIQRNELTPAVGNARVNARGDELGAGGKIVRRREEVLRDYYQSSPSVPDEPAGKPAASAPAPAPATSPTTKVEPQTKPAAKTVNNPTPAELAEFNDAWQEDEDGNFVKKGKK